ncbi:undecaprenyl pyrophosphate phosphatase [Bacteroidales bacterium Barb6XT]|nr:undecaprenyl pyrophosphate phosphatase [Bacteroidales bacterium Barb6XT]
MLEKVLEYERELFFLLNGSHTASMDHIIWLYSGKTVWLPAAFFILILLTYKVKWREWLLVLLAIALVITLCDQFASHLCKPLFMRLRPTHHPDFMEQVQTVSGYRGGQYGFISSHAANAFGFATFLTLLFRYKPLITVTLYLWATITAYTRIYLGVHFISDIVPGIASGILFGSLVYTLYVKVRAKLTVQGEKVPLQPSFLYSLTRQRLVVAAIILTAASLPLLSLFLYPLP